MKVLVIGATGNQGGHVARLLLQKGQGVAAFTRQAQSPAAQKLVDLGARIVTGDLNDRASVERAAEGVDAIFAMGTPFEAGIEAEIRQCITVAEAARARGKSWSTIGSRQPTGTLAFPISRSRNGRSSSTSPGSGQKLPSLRPSTSWKIS